MPGGTWVYPELDVGGGNRTRGLRSSVSSGTEPLKSIIFLRRSSRPAESSGVAAMSVDQVKLWVILLCWT